MKCPECKSANVHLKVIATKSELPDHNHRYIECDVCGTSFQSVEPILRTTIVRRSKVLDEGPLFSSIVPQNKPTENEEN